MHSCREKVAKWRRTTDSELNKERHERNYERRLRFIGESIDPAEQRIEITVLEVARLRENKRLRQSLNVPKNEEAVIP